MTERTWEHSYNWPRTTNLDGAHCSIPGWARGVDLGWRTGALPRSAQIRRVRSPSLPCARRWKGWGFVKAGAEGRIRRTGWRVFKKGLSFLWTCLIFAVAEIATLWANSPVNVYDEDDMIEYASDVWDALPELVAARFVLAVRPICRKPDLQNMTRRLPAWENIEKGGFDNWRVRVDGLADLIERIERGTAGRFETVQSAATLKPGTLVFNDALGVTALAATRDNRKCYLVDLSGADEDNPKNTLRIFFAQQVKRVILPPSVGELIWRVPEWLGPHSG